MLRMREEFEISKRPIIVRGKPASHCEPGRYHDVQNAQHQSAKCEAKNSKEISDNYLPNVQPCPSILLAKRQCKIQDLIPRTCDRPVWNNAPGVRTNHGLATQVSHRF